MVSSLTRVCCKNPGTGVENLHLREVTLAGFSMGGGETAEAAAAPKGTDQLRPSTPTKPHHATRSCRCMVAISRGEHDLLWARTTSLFRCTDHRRVLGLPDADRHRHTTTGAGATCAAAKGKDCDA